MADAPPLVTAADISRYVGVTRATVSNWRRRHPDFPAIAGGTEARPMFNLDEVKVWLTAHGYDSALSPVSELRTLVQAHIRPEEVAPLLATVGVEHGKLTVTGRPGRLSPDLWKAIRTVADVQGARTVLEALAERALQGALESGVHWTPEVLGRLMARLLGTQSGDYPRSVLDPACGRGGLLAAAARLGAVELYGQDVVPVQTELARLSVALETGIGPHMHTGDSLRADAFQGLQVDAVLCNPPFGQRDWGAEELKFDSRWEYGEPVRIDSELAWVQHGLAHLRPGGTAVYVLPPAVATRASGRRIRAALLRTGTLRAVIALPGRKLLSTGLTLELWVLRRPSPAEAMPGRVLFVDTPADRELLDQFADDVESMWQDFDTAPESFTAVPDVAASIPVITLLDDLIDLTPSRYTRVPLDPQTLSTRIDEMAEELTSQIEMARTGLEAIRNWTVAQPKTWRTTTLSDLVQGGALRMLRTGQSPKQAVAAAAVDPARPMLSGRDLVSGVQASGTANELPEGSEPVLIEPGDVLLPTVRGTHTDVVPVRVADEGEAGAVAGTGVLVLRPDPARIDPWFLAGFATSADNTAPTSGGSSIRTDIYRIRIPLLPLSEQGGYGAAFRSISELRNTAHLAARSADVFMGLASVGLTTGALHPSDDREGRSRWTD